MRQLRKSLIILLRHGPPLVFYSLHQLPFAHTTNSQQTASNIFLAPCDCYPQLRTCISSVYKMAQENELGVPVELNVYDLLHRDNPDFVPNINWYLYSIGMGLYHSGVCVYGTEYCYGGHPENHSGVFQVRPRRAPEARFRQTVLIGRTLLTRQQVREVIQAMSEVWIGNTYNLLTR